MVKKRKNELKKAIRDIDSALEVFWFNKSRDTMGLCNPFSPILAIFKSIIFISAIYGFSKLVSEGYFMKYLQFTIIGELFLKLLSLGIIILLWMYLLPYLIFILGLIFRTILEIIEKFKFGEEQERKDLKNGLIGFVIILLIYIAFWWYYGI